MADPDPTPTPTPDPKPDPTPDPAPPAPSFEPITSQEDFDRRIQERIARVKATPPADYEDLKKKAAEFDKLQEANKTELEKAQERAAKAEREAADATTRAQESLLRSSVIAEAARKNVVDPDAAVALIDRTAIEFADDGTPKNLSEVMNTLLDQKPYLVNGSGGARPDGADQGARSGGTKDQLGRDALKDMSPEQVRQALSEGKLSGVLEGGSS